MEHGTFHGSDPGQLGITKSDWCCGVHRYSTNQPDELSVWQAGRCWDMFPCSTPKMIRLQSLLPIHFQISDYVGSHETSHFYQPESHEMHHFLVGGILRQFGWWHSQHDGKVIKFHGSSHHQPVSGGRNPNFRDFAHFPRAKTPQAQLLHAFALPGACASIGAELHRQTEGIHGDPLRLDGTVEKMLGMVISPLWTVVVWCCIMLYIYI